MLSWAICLTRNSISSSQLRRFFNEFRSLEKRVDSAPSFDTVLPLIKMVKSKVSYAAGRGSGQQIPDTFKKFLNYTPLLYHGTNARDITIKDLNKATVVISTYGMVSKGFMSGKTQTLVSPVKTPIQQVKWQRVIMDEAHHIRNSETSSFKGALALNRNITWLVTGTPIQNKTSDFYSLCLVLGLDESSYESIEAVKKTIKKYVLRRTKKGVEIGSVG